jgi:hypothetical protein
MIDMHHCAEPEVDGYSPLTFEETPAVRRTGDPPPTLTDQRAIERKWTCMMWFRF